MFGTDPNTFLATHAHVIPPGGRVLSVADGEGRNSVWLAEHGFVVDAFDASPIGVAKARRLASRRGVSIRFDVGDAETWRWPEDRYDAVVAIFIQFADPALRRRIFAGALRALRPGGVLILEGYALEHLAHGTGGPRIPDHLYTEAQVRSELAEWSIEHLEAYETDLREGEAHSGPSSLIGVIARRP